LHGGTVEAASEGVGRGATFSVRLPMTAAGASSIPSESPVQFFETSDDLSGVNVVLVEDDPDTRAFLTVVLEQGHARVRAYALADEVLEAFREWQPDVLICDIGLPHKDGYELIREIRRIESDGRIPAIALTAYTSPEDRHRALAAGFETHVSKPVDPAELVRIVAEYARKNDE
jgi:CheY-like chemotaxis protein